MDRDRDLRFFGIEEGDHILARYLGPGAPVRWH